MGLLGHNNILLLFNAMAGTDMLERVVLLWDAFLDWVFKWLLRDVGDTPDLVGHLDPVEPQTVPCPRVKICVADEWKPKPGLDAEST